MIFLSELMAKILGRLRHTDEQGKDSGVQQSSIYPTTSSWKRCRGFNSMSVYADLSQLCCDAISSSPAAQDTFLAPAALLIFPTVI